MKILKNQTVSPILINDTGITVPASPSTYVIPSQDYALWAASSDIITQVGASNIVVNDGSFDLTKADAIALIQGNFKQADFIPALKNNDRLKVDVLFNGLTTDNVAEGTTRLYFTDERAQDAIGTILTDTPSVDLTYNDAGNTISAAVLPAGVDHNSLQNYSTNRHIDHSAVSIFAGTGLSGGGDITTSRTISMPNVGIAGTYGSASSTNTITTDAQGRITNVVNNPILITSSSISDFTEAAQDSVGNILTDSSSIDFTYNDAGNTITAAVIPGGVNHSSLSNLTSGDPHTQYINREANATVTDNSIVRWDLTTGRDVQNSLTTVDDNGGIIASDLIRPGPTSDTTAGNIQYNGTELLGRYGSTWRVLGLNPSSTNSTTSVSTTSATFATISGMSLTPSSGIYFFLFTADVALGGDDSGEVSIFVNGVQQAISTKTISIEAIGTLGAEASISWAFSSFGMATIASGQTVDVRFRSTAGTLTVNNREFYIIPITR